METERYGVAPPPSGSWAHDPARSALEPFVVAGLIEQASAACIDGLSRVEH